MPRKKKVLTREVLPDPKFGSILVTKFINVLMLAGKKSTAEHILYTAISLIEQRTGQNGLEIFSKALDNVKPVIEVKSRRVGGATYQVPVEVRSDRRQSLAIRWLIAYSKQRSERTMSEALAAEILAAFKNEGASVKKREDTHKMAEANKAFAHFKW
jgi:small subunit ribosomal protein S7